jgi:hypothetical protein
MPDNPLLHLRYRYVFADGTHKEFEACIDENSMSLIPPARSEFPAWTALACSRCPNCPLDEKEHVHCPTAVALIDVVDFCADRISYQKVHATVTTPKRTFVHDTTLQIALSSLIGVCMATAGCPVMERLRPMARFHLPFADEDETMFRAMSAYLLGQYFIMKKGGRPDWEMKNLAGMYDEIKAVNQSFCNRLRMVSTKDSNVNAVIGLDCFADAVIFSINQRFMDELELLYQAYVK